ncbi:hypothetical protein ACTQ4G_03965 [Streptococcus alactolyticus]|uniref:hypothetical protein n=1 Tax=Streptococcus alactolyticus TaxID=29389 RepID=UPI003F989A80
MVRRSTNYKVVKHNRLEGIAKRKGDIIYLGFQCLNYKCDEFLFVKYSDVFADEELTDFQIVCPKCDFNLIKNGETKIYDYTIEERDLENISDDSIDESTLTWNSIEEGSFIVQHNTYIKKSQKYKYCIICSTLQPVSNFSIHNSRKSGRQGECISCKDTYNSFKNGTRTSEQFAESAQKRRLYSDLAGNEKIQTKIIRENFSNRCFNCGLDLSKKNTTAHLDHTLPAKYLWSLNTNNATLLCSTCNGNKSDMWPGKFYSEQKIRELSIRTNYSYELLKGPEQYNPIAIEKLHNPEIVDNILRNYAKHIDEIIKIRNRILKDTGFDFFEVSKIISPQIIAQADKKIR